jgi:hypothetical protein
MLLGVAAGVLSMGWVVSAQTDPPYSGDWVIADQTSLSGQALLVTGNVIVTRGGSLNLTNVDLRMDSTMPGEFGVIVQAGGRLSIKGGSVSSVSALNTYRFEIYGPTTIDGATVQNMWGSPKGDRFGIQIYDGNTTIANSTIQLGDRGNILVAAGSPTIRNNVIRLARYVITGESPGACDAYLYYGAKGLLVTNDSSPLVEGNVFRDNGDSSAFADPWQYYFDNYYDNSTCWRSGYYTIYEYFVGDGIHVSGSRVELFNNTVTANSRVPSPTYSSRFVNNTTIITYRYAEEPYSGIGPGAGLFLEGASGNITNNLIDRNAGVGVLGDGSFARVERNAITNHGGIGVAVRGGLTLGNSSLTGNSMAIALIGWGVGSFENVSLGSGAGPAVFVDYTGTGLLEIYNTSFKAYTVAVSHQSRSGAVVGLFNCTIEASQITTAGWGAGTVYLYWALTARIQWANGAPAPNAFAIITNQTHGILYADVVGPAGVSAPLWIAGVIIAFTNGGSQTIINTPLSIKVYANGTVSNGFAFEFNRSLELLVTILDPIPPTLNVFAPTVGARVNTSAVVVEGNAFDVGSGMDRVQVSGDGGDTWVASTRALPGWSVTLVLADGSHTLKVRAYDIGGGFTEVEIPGLLVDTVAPRIFVTQPALPLAGEKVVYTNATGLVLRGSLEDDAVLSLNGQAVPFSGGIFARQLVLSEGTNFFRLVAVDPGGNTDQVDFVIVSDTIRAAIYVSAPVENFATNRSSLTVAGVTESDVALFLNGAPISAVGGVFSVSYSLSEGTNSLTIAATDRSGNTNSVTRTVHFDTIPPEIVVIAPANNLVTSAREIELVGTVESSIATVYVNGAPLPTNQGQFSKTVRLDEGANVLVLQAWDAAVNPVLTSITVTLDTTPPTLTLTAPSDGALVNTSGVRVRASFSGATSALVNGVPVELEAGEIDEQVALAEGRNDIEVVALDAAGNRAQARLTVERDTIAPDLTVNLPATPLHTSENLIEFTGRALGARWLRVNGHLVAMDAGGNFTVVLPLSLGQNEIVLTATDEAGNAQTVLGVVDRTLPAQEPQGLFGLGDLSYALLPAFLALGAAVTFFVLGRNRPAK